MSRLGLAPYLFGTPNPMADAYAQKSVGAQSALAQQQAITPELLQRGLTEIAQQNLQSAQQRAEMTQRYKLANQASMDRVFADMQNSLLGAVKARGDQDIARQANTIRSSALGADTSDNKANRENALEIAKIQAGAHKGADPFSAKVMEEMTNEIATGVPSEFILKAAADRNLEPSVFRRAMTPGMAAAETKGGLSLDAQFDADITNAAFAQITRGKLTGDKEAVTKAAASLQPILQSQWSRANPEDRLKIAALAARAGVTVGEPQAPAPPRTWRDFGADVSTWPGYGLSQLGGGVMNVGEMFSGMFGGGGQPEYSPNPQPIQNQQQFPAYAPPLGPNPYPPLGPSPASQPDYRGYRYQSPY